MRRLWRSALAALSLVAFIWSCAAADLWLRARSAYRRAELYLSWQSDPGAKRAFFDAELARVEGELARDFSQGRLTAETMDQRLALARHRRDERVSESSLKYAYAWLRAASELHAPPESPWSAEARRRLPEIRRLWESELRAQGVRFDSYQLD
ncbi:MAG: hypothetical protein HY549_13455 [Elusimicrobia bacterium]|nr:hypothetical protein [Elusimicrobiota bacterium]